MSEPINPDPYQHSQTRPPSRALSLRSRMMLGFGVLVVVIVTAVVGILLFGMPFTSHRGIYEQERAQVVTNLGFVADLKKERLLMWLRERKSDIRVLAASADVRTAVEKVNAFLRSGHPGGEVGGASWAQGEDGPGSQTLAEHLQVVREAYRQYEKITVVTSEGGLIVASTEKGEVGKPSTHNALMREASNDKSGLSVGIDAGRSTGTPHLVISHVVESTRSVEHPDGTVVGWVNACIDLDSFLKPLLYTGGKLGETADIVLVDQYRRILISPRFPLPDGSKAQLSNYIIKGEPARLSANGSDGVIVTRDYRDENVLAAYRHIDVTPNERWRLVVKVDMSEVFAPVRQTVFDASMIGLAGLIAALGLAFFVSGRISLPIEKLSQFARRVESGDLETRAPTTGSREVASLAGALNHMIRSVQEWRVKLEEKVAERTAELRTEISERKLTEQALRESEERFRSAFTHSRIGMALLAVDGRFMAGNNALCRLLGYSEQELSTMDFKDISDPRDAEESSKRFKALVSGKTDGYYFEQRCVHKNGTTIWGNLTVSVVRYSDQLPIYAVLQLNDITDRKRAEEQLRQSEKRFRRLVETANEGVWAK
ncbi:MAG: PAS domain S-box protein [Deltaproteobacteria bacterium]